MILSNQKAVPESTHYYRMDGSPCYTVIGANGKERPVTIREARTLHLVPSVTQVLKVMANDGIKRYIEDQIIKAAWNYFVTAQAASALSGNISVSDFESYQQTVRADSKDHAKTAAELGTSIHASLEQAYEGVMVSHDPLHVASVTSTMRAIKNTFGEQDWKAEKSFADEHWLYGGKIDLCSTDIVIDFKTSAFDETKKEREFGYLEHQIQISAYAAAIGCTRGVNVYVSTSVPGLVHIKEWSEQEMADGFEMFRAALKFWQIKNKYEVKP
jgi:hypothetical protein